MNTPTPRTDAAWSCFSGYTEPLQDVKDLSHELERELAEAIKQRDRLVADLRIIADGTSCRECGGEDQALLAREALQSLNQPTKL